MTNLFFEPPFWGLRGNVRTSSIACSKARGQLPIRDNWTFFANSYGWDVLSRYWSKLALFRGGRSLWAQILGGSGRRPNHSWCHVMLPHREDRVILSSFISIRYQRVTDGQTDRGTELPWLMQRSALQAMRPRRKNPLLWWIEKRNDK